MEIYVVQAGDTLNAIAQRSGLSAERIASENRLFPPYELVVGQTLVLRFPDHPMRPKRVWNLLPVNLV